MNIGKWGNSLAVRLPKDVVDALGLKEGDEIKFTPVGPKHIEVSRDDTVKEALIKLRKYRGMIPADFKFNRDEAHERG